LNNVAQSQSEKETLDQDHTQAEKDLIEALRRQRGFTHAAVTAVLRARGLLRLTIAATLTALAGGDDLVSWLYAQLVEEKLRSLQLLRANRILRERMYRLDNRHRNRYTPRERFLIVLYKVTYGLTAEQTASEFVVSPQTVKRWIDQAVREPCKRTIGSLLKAVPPLMGYSDVLQDQVAVMDEMGFGGNLRIAQTLARAGVKLSRETIRRWRNQGRMPGGADARPRPTKTGPILKAKYPNHIWMLDITEIAGLFRLFKFKLAVVLDVFSRMPLAGRVFTTEPSAADMVALVEHAAAKHGAPKHFVTDQGSQFTSDVFRAALIALGVLQRFGAVGDLLYPVKRIILIAGALAFEIRLGHFIDAVVRDGASVQVGISDGGQPVERIEAISGHVAHRVSVDSLVGKAVGSSTAADHLVGARRVGVNRSYARNRPACSQRLGLQHPRDVFS
jgi:hypothetical protein